MEEELEGSEQVCFASDQLFYQWDSSFLKHHSKGTSSSKQQLIYGTERSDSKDTFIHEQNLIVEEDAKTLLIVGCAHNGIINILEHFRA